MYDWEQDQIAHMKEYIARFGHGSAKLAKQAQSKEKTLAKMQAGGLTEKVVMEKTVKLHFHQCGSLPPPVLQFTNVTFGYTPDKILYSKLDFGVDLDSRIALVGPNGAGKSTLLKLMVHELECLDGIVRRHPHLRIARFHQHLTDLLDPELTPLEYIIKEFSPMEPTVARSQIGRFGITGDAQTAKMKNLSDGQKSRVSLAPVAREAFVRRVCVDSNPSGGVFLDCRQKTASSSAGRAHEPLGPGDHRQSGARHQRV